MQVSVLTFDLYNLYLSGLEGLGFRVFISALGEQRLNGLFRGTSPDFQQRSSDRCSLITFTASFLRSRKKLNNFV